MMNLIAKYTRCGAQQVWIYYFLCLFNSLLSYPKKAKKSLRRLFYECRYHLTSFDYYCTTAESEDFFSFFSSLMTTKNSQSFSRRNLALSKEKDHWFNAILALGLLFSNDLLEYYDFNSGMYYSYPRILQFSIIEVSLDCIQKSYFVVFTKLKISTWFLF